MTFSVFPDIFYPQNFRCFEENRLFQHHPQALSLTMASMSPVPMLEHRQTWNRHAPPAIRLTLWEWSEVPCVHLFDIEAALADE